jgi:hypothetical protein
LHAIRETVSFIFNPVSFCDLYKLSVQRWRAERSVKLLVIVDAMAGRKLTKEDEAEAEERHGQLDQDPTARGNQADSNEQPNKQ